MPHQDMSEPFFNVSERQPPLLQDQIMEGLKNPACRLFVNLKNVNQKDLNQWEMIPLVF